MSDTRAQSLLRTSNIWRVGLIALAIMASLIAGASYLVYASPLSPLIIGGACAAVVSGLAWVRKPVWALYVAIFVILLPGGLIPGHIHSILNRGMLLIALGVWLCDAITRRRRIVWTSTTLLMLGFLIWGMVTLSWMPRPSIGMESLIKYALRTILFLFLIVNEVNTKETLNGLMRILALNGWVLVLAGVETILSAGGYKPGTRLVVLEMNENQFGVSILITMPGVLWQAMQTSGWQKALRMSLSVAYVLLTLGLVALSGSRGSAISLSITLLAFWFWKPTRPWGKLALLILVVAAVSTPFVFSTTLERFAVERGDTMLGDREALWQAAWLLIRDHPWRGVGIGNAPYAIMPYAVLLKSLPGEEWVAVHNPVLAIWAETGFPGMLLYLGVLASAVWLFLRQYFYCMRTGMHSLTSYFALVSCVFIGFMPSWIKGGGMQTHFTYFLMLALLLIPSQLDVEGWDPNTESNVQDAARRRQ